jgi:hypothetical protein
VTSCGGWRKGRDALIMNREKRQGRESGDKKERGEARKRE